MVEGAVPHAVGAVTDHVILAVGAPHKPVDAVDRMTPVEYQAVTAESKVLECTICGLAAAYPIRIHEMGCPHCPCLGCNPYPGMPVSDELESTSHEGVALSNGSGPGMTKYVLHGGRSYVDSSDNQLFYQEVLKELAGSLNVLLVYYARDESSWAKLLELDQRNFLSVNDNCELSFSVASTEPTVFLEQIKSAHVIFIVGGKTINLKRRLGAIPNLGELLEGKVVAGSSAGVHVLSKYYYNRAESKVNTGLNLLPVKIFSHFTVEQSEALHLLEQNGDSSETIAVEEGKFVVLNK
jgi:peptidase E